MKTHTNTLKRLDKLPRGAIIYWDPASLKKRLQAEAEQAQVLGTPLSTEACLQAIKCRGVILGTQEDANAGRCLVIIASDEKTLAPYRSDAPFPVLILDTCKPHQGLCLPQGCFNPGELAAYSEVTSLGGGTHSTYKLTQPGGKSVVIKFGANDAALKIEALFQICCAHLLESSVPDMQIVTHIPESLKEPLKRASCQGVAIVSAFIDSLPRTPENKQRIGELIRDHFLVHAFLGAIDIAGPDDESDTPGNVLLHTDKQHITTIDYGANCIYHSLGTLRQIVERFACGEIDSLRDPKRNPATFAWFGQLTLSDFRQQAQTLTQRLRVLNHVIPDACEKLFILPHERDQLIDILVARWEKIQARYLPHITQCPLLSSERRNDDGFKQVKNHLALQRAMPQPPTDEPTPHHHNLANSATHLEAQLGADAVHGNLKKNIRRFVETKCMLEPKYHERLITLANVLIPEENSDGRIPLYHAADNTVTFAYFIYREFWNILQRDPALHIRGSQKISMQHPDIHTFLANLAQDDSHKAIGDRREGFSACCVSVNYFFFGNNDNNLNSSFQMLAINKNDRIVSLWELLSSFFDEITFPQKEKIALFRLFQDTWKDQGASLLRFQLTPEELTSNVYNAADWGKKPLNGVTCSLKTLQDTRDPDALNDLQARLLISSRRLFRAEQVFWEPTGLKSSIAVREKIRKILTRGLPAMLAHLNEQQEHFPPLTLGVRLFRRVILSPQRTLENTRMISSRIIRCICDGKLEPLKALLDKHPIFLRQTLRTQARTYDLFVDFKKKPNFTVMSKIISLNNALASPENLHAIFGSSWQDILMEDLSLKAWIEFGLPQSHTPLDTVLPKDKIIPFFVALDNLDILDFIKLLENFSSNDNRLLACRGALEHTIIYYGDIHGAFQCFPTHLITCDSAVNFFKDVIKYQGATNQQEIALQLLSYLPFEEHSIFFNRIQIKGNDILDSGFTESSVCTIIDDLASCNYDLMVFEALQRLHELSITTEQTATLVECVVQLKNRNQLSASTCMIAPLLPLIRRLDQIHQVSCLTKLLSKVELRSNLRRILHKGSLSPDSLCQLANRLRNTGDTHLSEQLTYYVLIPLLDERFCLTVLFQHLFRNDKPPKLTVQLVKILKTPFIPIGRYLDVLASVPNKSSRQFLELAFSLDKCATAEDYRALALFLADTLDVKLVRVFTFYLKHFASFYNEDAISEIISRYYEAHENHSHFKCFFTAFYPLAPRVVIAKLCDIIEHSNSHFACAKLLGHLLHDTLITSEEAQKLLAVISKKSDFIHYISMFFPLYYLIKKLDPDHQKPAMDKLLTPHPATQGLIDKSRGYARYDPPTTNVALFLTRFEALEALDEVNTGCPGKNAFHFYQAIVAAGYPYVKRPLFFSTKILIRVYLNDRKCVLKKLFRSAPDTYNAAEMMCALRNARFDLGEKLYFELMGDHIMSGNPNDINFFSLFPKPFKHSYAKFTILARKFVRRLTTLKQLERFLQAFDEWGSQGFTHFVDSSLSFNEELIGAYFELTESSNTFDNEFDLNSEIKMKLRRCLLDYSMCHAKTRENAEQVFNHLYPDHLRTKEHEKIFRSFLTFNKLTDSDDSSESSSWEYESDTESSSSNDESASLSAYSS